MGTRGPVPKRSANRRRRNKESRPDQFKVKGEKLFRPLPANKEWPESVKQFYKVCLESEVREFWATTDYAMLHLGCDLLARCYQEFWITQKHNATLVGQANKIFEALCLTESARRRNRIEFIKEDMEKQSKGKTGDPFLDGNVTHLNFG